MEYTDAGLSTLQVVAGSPETTVLDTSIAAVWQGMRDQGCFVNLASAEGNAQDLLAEDRTGNPPVGPELGVATINYADGSIVRIDRPNGDSRLRFTPGTATGMVTIFTANATSYSGSLNSKPGPGPYPIALYSRVVDSSADMITVVIRVLAPNAPTSSVSVNPTSVFAGGTSVATVTIANNNNPTATITGIANTINLPAGVTVSATPGASTTCGGTITAAAGGSTVTLAGGSNLAPGASCTMTFNITPSTVATHTIPSGTPSATGANAGSPGTTATLTATTPPSPPTITANWDAADVAVNATGRKLTVTVTNPNAITLTGVGFNAGTLPLGFNVTNLAGTCVGTSYNGGNRQLAMSGHTLAAGASCTATLDFTVATRGAYTFATGTAFATGPAAVTGGFATTGTLTVWSPPTVTVTAASPITTNAPSTVTLTFFNANTGALTGVGTTAAVSLPGGVVIHSTPGISNGCGGGVTAAAGAGTFTVSGLTVPGSGNCPVTFNVTSSAAASYQIPTGTPTSSEGGAGAPGTPAPLVVNLPAPVLTAMNAAAVAYNSSSNTINVRTGTGATNSPTAWLVSKDGTTFAAAAESVNNTGSNNVSIANDGTVTYAPPTGRRGSDSFFVRASNTTGNSNVVAVTVPIDNPILAISLTGSGVRGTPLSGVAVVTTGGRAPYSCSAPTAAMPAGVAFDTATCTLNGTPSVAGSTVFRVTVTDSSTGTGPFTQQSLDLTLTINPPPPTITSLVPNVGTTLGGTSVRINGTNFDSGQVGAITIDGAAALSPVVDASGTFITVTTPAHPAGTVRVQVSTTGGTTPDTSNDDFTYSAPPAPPVVTVPADNLQTNNTTPTYQGTAAAGVDVEVFVNSASIGIDTSRTGNWSLVQPTVLSPGSYSVTAFAIKPDGIRSAVSNTRNFQVDTTPPAAPIVTSPITGTRTADTTPTFAGTFEAGSTVRVFIGGIDRGAATLSSPNWTFDSPALAEGTYTFWAVATDAAGNSAQSTPTGSLTIDTTAPPPPVISAPLAGATTSPTPMISGTAEDASTVTVTVNGEPSQNVVATGGVWSIAWAPALTPGSRTVSATARDAANNLSAPPTIVAFTVAGLPTVDSLSVNAGPTAGGNSVTLTGTNLSNASDVRFGSNPATITANSATSITVTVPGGVAGTVNVSATTVGGTSVDAPGNAYTYVERPIIGSITPTSGPASGATAVTINGANLSGVTDVSFGGTPATFAPGSATSFIATSPAGSGVVDITVTTAGGTSATGTSAFTYLDPATVTDVTSPQPYAASNVTIDVAAAANPSLPVSGWQVATSSGGTYGASAATQYGGTVSISAAGSATYTAPAGFRGPDRFYFVATNGGGASNEGVVQVDIQDPVLTIALSPTTVDLGTPLTGAALSVAVSGNGPAGYSCGPLASGALPAGLTRNSDCTITGTPTAFGTFDFTLPVTVATVGPAGSNPYAETSLTLSLTVTDTRPTVTAIAPDSGGTAGGTSVTITGTYLSNPTAVSFGGTPAQSFAAGSATTMTAVAPIGSGTGNVVVTTAIGSSGPAPENLYTWIPAAPSVAAPAGGSTIADSTPDYSGTAEAGATVNVSVDGGAAIAVAADGAGNWSYTQASALSDGLHAVEATATVAGITGAASPPVSFTVDASAPGTPAITAPLNNTTTRDNTPDISGTAEAGAAVTVYIDGVAAGTTIATGGNWSLTAATLSDGLHPIYVTATDGVGNISGASATVNFTVDTTAPPAPIVVAPADGSIGNVVTPMITGTAEANAAITVYIDGAMAGTTTATGGTWTFMPGSALADGLHTARATATDAGGNVSIDSNINSFTIDAAVPAAPLITAPADGLTTSVSTQTISGTGEPGATVTVYLNAASIGTTSVAGGGAWSLSTGPRTDGAYAVTATVTDAANNTSPASTTVNYTIDTIAPGAPVLTAPDDGVFLNVATPTITGTAEAGANVTVRINGAAAGTVIANGGAWSLTSAALADGTYTVDAAATDAAGSLSGNSATRTFTIDTLAPAAPVVSAPANGSTIATNTPLIAGAAQPNATITVSVDGTPVGTVAASGGGAWSFQTVAVLPAGNHNASATATDAAGNVSASGASSFLVEFPPVASDLSGVTVPYDTAQTIDLAPSIAGNYASVAVGTAPAHGSASIAGTVVTYTPAAGYYGADSFTYTAAGPGGVSNPATVSLTVATPNAPVTTDRPGVAIAYQSSGTAIDLTASVTGVSASIAVATAPAHGTASVAGNVVTYVPATGYYGADSFTFTATGPGGTSNASTVSLTVGNPPAPVAADRSGVPVAYDSSGTDIDLSAAITGVRSGIAIVTPPAHGTASVAGEIVTYTPASGYFGADSFTYTATGPGGTSPPATVSLTVATPAAPIAADRSGVAIPYDSPGIAIDLAPSISGVHSSAAIAAPPAHGTASIAGDVVTYTPAAGYYGADAFTYTATGPGGTSPPATVSLTVATPAPPTAAGLAGIAVPYASAGTPVDLAPSIGGVHSGVVIGTAPAHGTTSIAGDVVTYTPAADYYGADGFTYAAVGPGGTSAFATVSLTVGNPPAPVAADRDGVAVAHNSAGTAIDLSGSITGVHTSIAIVTAPAHGTATISGDVVTYVPAVDYYGADSFTYAAAGPGGTSAAATVGLSVATPPAPSAQPGTGTVAGSTSVNANNAVQINLSALVTGRYDSIAIETPPAHGVVTLSGGTQAGTGPGQGALAITPVIATYRPAVGYAGVDSFLYVAIGPGGRSPAAAVTINVIGSAPVALPKAAATGDGEAVTVDLTAGATEGPFTGAAVVGVTPANSATTRIVDSGAGAARTFHLEITPNARFSGAVVVAYTLTNVYGTSAPADVTVTVTARPDPTADANVRGLIDAQAEAARRFARSQVANFMRRAEQLHGSGGDSDAAMGVTLNSRDGRGALRASPAFDASALEITERMRPSAEDPMLGAVANSRDSRWNRADTLGGMAAVTPGTRGGGRGGQGIAAQPGAGGGQPGTGEADGDGTRRKGSVAIWSGGAVDIGTRDATTDRTKITATTSGLSAGADIKLAEGVVVGLGGGYGNDVSHIGDDAARVRSTSNLVAAYASVSPGGTAFIDGMVGIGDLSFSTRRLVATVNANALGNRDGSFTVAALAAGIDQQRDSLRWSLYGRGELMDARLGAYAESGAGRYNLRFDERQLSSITGTLGGRIEFTGKSGSTQVTPRLRAEWNHEFADADPQFLDYADIPGGALFSLATTGWQRDQFQLSLGTRFVFPRSWAIDIEAGLRGGGGEKAGTLRFQISKEF